MAFNHFSFRPENIMFHDQLTHQYLHSKVWLLLIGKAFNVSFWLFGGGRVQGRALQKLPNNQFSSGAAFLRIIALR